MTAVEEALAAVPAEGSPRLLLENSAGTGPQRRGRFEELAELMLRLGPHADRVGICFDTAHAHSAGYDMGGAEMVGDSVAELETVVGLDRIFVIHANDTQVEAGGKRDATGTSARARSARTGSPTSCTIPSLAATLHPGDPGRRGDRGPAQPRAHARAAMSVRAVLVDYGHTIVDYTPAPRPRCWPPTTASTRGSRSSWRAPCRLPTSSRLCRWGSTPR